jgi:predicted glycosyl hydrolase (DUF1957 family)
LFKYPQIQAVLHYSGVLLQWIERFHPEMFMLIEDMVSRKQAEMLGGGFYEPMLALLPLQDKIGQIELLTTYLRRHFGKRPLGCWIPAYAWEQNLVAPLSACGLTYTFLREDQFINSGLKIDDLYLPCITEDQGKLITVFPVFYSLGKKLAELNFQAVFGDLYNKMPKNTDSTITIFPGAINSISDMPDDYLWN